MLDLSALAEVSESAMTRDVAIAMRADGLPNAFVPGRNLIFLTFAAALAYRRGFERVVAGVCETDYSGYPDCRDDSNRGRFPGRLGLAQAGAGLTRVARSGIFGPGIPSRSPMKS